MTSLGWSLFMALHLWGLFVGVAPWTVGPCDIIAIKASFNCSGRKLTEVPGEVWANATMLDLSQNSLNFTRPATLRALGRLEGLVLLNLSGSYLPLLDSKMLAGLQHLRVLDLSSTQLAEIKPGAFQAFPKLHTLLLGNNRLRDPLPAALGDLRALSFLDLHGNDHLSAAPPAWLKGVHQVIRPRAWCGLELGDVSGGASSFLRKLLVEDDVKNRSLKAEASGEDVPGPMHTWSYVMAGLMTTLSVAGLVVLAVKCKVLRRYLASYRHALLPEGDASSQCSHAGLGLGLPGYDSRGDRLPPELEDDDDDGFIEDNYIQASERQRAEREAEGGEEEEEEEEGQGESDDDDLHFSIG